MKLLLTLLLTLLAFAPLNFAMTPKAKFTISFHAQGDEMSSPRTIFRLSIPGYPDPVVFEKVPQFSQMQIAAFHSFPAEDGETLGLTLKLDFRGKNALDVLSRTRTGQLLVAMINGQPVDYVMVDSPISDGVITIWRGVTQPVIDELAKKYPTINKLPSMSTGHDDMLPTTKGEKRRSMKQVKEENAQQAKDTAIEAKGGTLEKNKDLLKRNNDTASGSFDPAPAKPQKSQKPQE
jgi:hypothetical protein